MVCDTKLREGQRPAERLKEVLEAAKKLEQLLAAGTVQVKIGPQGAILLTGWSQEERRGINDACAYRLLAQTWAMRQAVARAEALAGRKLNPAQIAGGTHSHDGGATWHPGH